MALHCFSHSALIDLDPERSSFKVEIFGFFFYSKNNEKEGRKKERRKSSRRPHEDDLADSRV